jgi:hypothetical protein
MAVKIPAPQNQVFWKTLGIFVQFIEAGKVRQSNLQRLQKLVKEKEESGILQRKQYEIPSIDKTGRYFRKKFLKRRKAH